MKTIILAVLLACMSFAYGEEVTPEQQEKNKEITYHCGQLGGVFEMAAGMRDDGIRPEDTLKYVAGHVVSPQEKKDAINLVYFNPAFANARGKSLMMAVFNTCVFGPPKPFERLK
jgi:hypothetical protein